MIYFKIKKQNERVMMTDRDDDIQTSQQRDQLTIYINEKFQKIKKSMYIDE